MSEIITSFSEAVEATLRLKGEHDAEFTINEDDREFKVYAVHVSYGGLTCYSDKACLSYVVDYYGDRGVPELYEIEEIES